MITVIHGEDVAASRKYLSECKKVSQNHALFSGERLTLTDLTQAASSGGLFAEEQHIVIENLLTRKKSQELDAIIAYIKNDKETTYTLWEPKALNKTQLGSLTTATIKNFPIPQILFSFLDALKPHNGTQLVKLFHEMLQNTEVEMIFFMLIRQFRILLTIQNATSTIEEVKRLSPWQKEKLLKQSQQFSESELKTTYRKLFEIDLGNKTGTLMQPLPMAIDIFLLEI